MTLYQIAYNSIDLEEYLTGIIDNGIEGELDRRLLVLKDVSSYLDNPKIISLLKYISLKITQGLDSCIIIVNLHISPFWM